MRSVRTWLRVAVIAIMAGQAIGQQGAANTPKYEVVSIRQVKGDPRSIRFVDLPDGFSMEGLPLKSLIPDAYGISQDDRVSGWPEWATSRRFDIEAKMDAETSDALRKLPKEQQAAQRQRMMQSLLADRFQLKVHRGSEIRTTYELVLAKGGSKMKEDTSLTDRAGVPWQEGVRPSTDWSISDGTIGGHAMPLSILADHLQASVHSTIVDKTGLTGRYDVMLQWDPRDEPAPNATEPPLATALEEQLGLRFKAVKATVETIIIDHLEMPSEN